MSMTITTITTATYYRGETLKAYTDNNYFRNKKLSSSSGPIATINGDTYVSDKEVVERMYNEKTIKVVESEKNCRRSKKTRS